MFGKETVIAVLMGFSPVLLIGHFEIPYVPLQLPMLLFGAFVGLLQAMVFSVLVAIYIAQFIEGHDNEEHH
jgi:F0F1-type ATP synthase membrane subunit a